MQLVFVLQMDNIIVNAICFLVVKITLVTEVIALFVELQQCIVHMILEKSNTNLLLIQQLNFLKIIICYDFDKTFNFWDEEFEYKWTDISLGQMGRNYLKDCDYFSVFFRRINIFTKMSQRYENFIPRKVKRRPCLMYEANQIHDANIHSYSLILETMPNSCIAEEPVFSLRVKIKTSCMLFSQRQRQNMSALLKVRAIFQFQHYKNDFANPE